MAKTHRICSIPGCGKKLDYLGLCSMHAWRMRQHGDPLHGEGKRCPNGEPRAWLEHHVGFSSDECLLWPYARHPNGYGAIRFEGLSTFPHRVMCRMAHGEPDDPLMEAAHSCRNKLCCNPRHLRWATHRDNEADKIEHGTASRGERQWMAKLTADDVRAIRSMASGMTDIEIAAHYDVDPSNIYAIRNGNSWVWLE